jgi:hypothetical protein
MVVQISANTRNEKKLYSSWDLAQVVL